MDTVDLDRLARDFSRLCESLGVARALPVAPSHDGNPHVEKAGEHFDYVVTERGRELVRRRTADPDELLYWLIADVVNDQAAKYEQQNHVPGQDFRRVKFRKVIEIMERLNPVWGRRARDRIRSLLANHPYRDDVD